MMIVSIILGGAIVLIIAFVALLGWGGLLSLSQRLGLAAIAAGIVWAGPGRALGREPGLGDALMLLGLLVYLASTYGPRLFLRLDGLDGKVDGKVQGPFVIVAGAFVIKDGVVKARNIEVDRIALDVAPKRKGWPWNR